MAGSLDLAVLREKETWQAFGIGVILFCIIAYSSLSIFGLSSSMYGVSDQVERVPDFEAISMNRTGVDDAIADDSGMVSLSDLRGKVVVLDFMSIDCVNCHYVQSHIEDKIDDWAAMEGEYPVVIISIASWYEYESFERINQTFGDPDSDRTMRWPVLNGAGDSVILAGGERGDLVEHYSAQSLPLALVIDHEGFVVAKEGTGTPLDGWGSFDDAVLKANSGDAEDLRFGIKKADRSFSGVFLIGLFLGILVYFSPCAFPVLPSYISYYLSLGVREDELREAGRIEGRIPGAFEVGGFAALGQLTFFGAVGMIIFGLDGIVSLSGLLHDIAVGIALLLVLLGSLMLLGWTSHLLAWVQRLLESYLTTESDERFTPRRNMYLWGIGYSAASVDCTAAAVFPFVAWLAVVGEGAFVFGMSGLMISVSLLMIAVTVLVGMGRDAMIDRLRRSTAIVKATGSWMMMFAGLGLLAYLTQPEMVSEIMG
ncbi:MAG: cytochrome c biogenesis protein CcdA [Candidatus Thalassarchaeaceae archaeon]|nr:cytochrome c biogenesis protein CcdA [Candidatus Thalassarchaeaceae archaeon]